MTMIRKLAVALTAAAMVVGAHASSIYSGNLGNGDQATDSSLSTTFSATGGTADVSFTLDGFNTLDGDNYWIDIFTLNVNGTDVFSGTWNLGGGGTDAILTSPSGATAVNNGSTVSVFVPVTLLDGSNELTFTYTSPTTFEGSTRAGFQGLADEGWGVGEVTVTALASAVPEPASFGMMAAGLALMGGLARRRARKSQD